MSMSLTFRKLLFIALRQAVFEMYFRLTQSELSFPDLMQIWVFLNNTRLLSVFEMYFGLIETELGISGLTLAIA
jgi:hypothetical protein